MADIQRIYDLKPSKPDLRDIHFSASFFKSLEVLPKVVDLRHLQSPVCDQKSLGFCFAFAAVGLREYIEIKNKQKFVPLSQLYLGHKTKLREGTATEDNGASIADVMYTLKTSGVCPENMDPYIPALFAAPTTVMEDLAAKQYAISTYSRVNNLIGLKTALAEGNVVEIGIAVYSSFESEETIKTGIVPYPNKQTEQCLGGHALLCCGYNDLTEQIIVKNSWGTGIGLEGSGYFAIPYKFMNDPELVIDMFTAS